MSDLYSLEDQFTYYGTDPMQRRIHMQQRAELIADMFGKRPMSYKEWGNTEGGGFNYMKTWGLSVLGAGVLIAGMAVPFVSIVGAGLMLAGAYNSYQEDKRMQDGYEQYLYKTSNEARAAFEARIRNQTPAPAQAAPTPQQTATVNTVTTPTVTTPATTEQATIPVPTVPEQNTSSFASRQAAPAATYATQADQDKIAAGTAMART